MRTTASRQVNESVNFTLALTLMENLEATVNLTCMFLQCVRQLQDPKRNSHKHKGNMQMSDRKPRANICNLLTWLWGRSANLYDTVWLRGSCLVLPKLPLSLYELHNNDTLENLHRPDILYLQFVFICLERKRHDWGVWSFCRKWAHFVLCTDKPDSMNKMMLVRFWWIHCAALDALCALEV